MKALFLIALAVWIVGLVLVTAAGHRAYAAKVEARRAEDEA
jgi:hypothetical protein